MKNDCVLKGLRLCCYRPSEMAFWRKSFVEKLKDMPAEIKTTTHLFKASCKVLKALWCIGRDGWKRGLCRRQSICRKSGLRNMYIYKKPKFREV